MPTERPRVTLIPDAIASAIAGYDLTPDPESGRREYTAAINGSIRRYAALIERGASELDAVLSREEWNALADANNGCADLYDYIEGGPATSPLLMFWANVQDSEGLGAKWGIDQRGLVKKLKALAPHHGEAILAAVRWFWQHCETVDSLKDEWWKPAYRASVIEYAKREGVPT